VVKPSPTVGQSIGIDDIGLDQLPAIRLRY
jgi:hypothetical protein